MLEGIEKMEQQSEILNVARKFRKALEVALLAECMKFEKETGLIIKELSVLRSARNPAAHYRENQSVLIGVDVNVGL